MPLPLAHSDLILRAKMMAELGVGEAGSHRLVCQSCLQKVGSCALDGRGLPRAVSSVPTPRSVGHARVDTRPLLASEPGGQVPSPTLKGNWCVIWGFSVLIKGRSVLGRTRCSHPFPYGTGGTLTGGVMFGASAAIP